MSRILGAGRRPTFRDPSAAEGAGYVLAVAGILVAGGLVLHPLPSGGFAERATILAGTPLWGAIHVAIAAGFVLSALGGLLMLVAGGPRRHWSERVAWGSIVVGMIYFTGVAMINAWVMHPLSEAVALGADPRVFDAFNRMLIGYGWLGNPLFLAGLTTIATLEVRDRAVGLPAWLAWAGLIVVLLSWLRGVGSATGLFFLEPFVLANVPAFLWFGWYGLAVGRRARAESTRRTCGGDLHRKVGGGDGGESNSPSRALRQGHTTSVSDGLSSTGRTTIGSLPSGPVTCP